MVIKTGTRQKRPGLPSKRPFGSVYHIVREGLKTHGFYQEYNLQQYDPQVYVDKYTYKPHKRIAGYAGKTLHESKTPAGYSKFGKTYSRRRSQYYNDKRCKTFGKGSYCSK